MDNIEKELTPVSDEDNSIEVVADAVAEATFESTTTPARVATAQNELKTPLIPSVKSHRAPKTNPKNSAPLSGNKGKVSTDKVRKSVSKSKSKSKLAQEDSDDTDSDTHKSPHPNGRVKGRKLVLWHRPRMMEKLILHLQYEAQRAGIDLPWDKAMERFNPGSSAMAATQMLAKMRDYLITEGHMVPPLIGKKGAAAAKPDVRGYIRDLKKDNPKATREVLWGEEIEDRSENLEVPGIIRGSGQYRRVAKLQADAEGTPDITPIRSRETANNRSRSRQVSGPKGRGSRATNKAQANARFPTSNPEDFDSEDDYDPNRKKPKYGLRAKPQRKYEMSEDDNSGTDTEFKLEDSDDENAFGKPPSKSAPRASANSGRWAVRHHRSKSNREENLSALNIDHDGLTTLRINPTSLSKFPGGEHGQQDEDEGLTAEVAHERGSFDNYEEEGFDDQADDVEDDGNESVRNMVATTFASYSHRPQYIDGQLQYHTQQAVHNQVDPNRFHDYVMSNPDFAYTYGRSNGALAGIAGAGGYDDSFQMNQNSGRFNDFMEGPQYATPDHTSSLFQNMQLDGNHAGGDQVDLDNFHSSMSQGIVTTHNAFPSHRALSPAQRLNFESMVASQDGSGQHSVEPEPASLDDSQDHDANGTMWSFHNTLDDPFSSM